MSDVPGPIVLSTANEKKKKECRMIIFFLRGNYNCIAGYERALKIIMGQTYSIF